MTNNGLISAEIIRIENFNSMILETKETSQFLAYYALLLHTAVEFLFISQEQANKISNAILETFHKRFEGTPIVMSNNMYVLTAYLKSMDNYNQLSILLKVTNSDEAEKLFDNSYQWLLKKIEEMEERLQSFFNDVIDLKEVEFKKAWAEIHSSVQELKQYSCIDTKLSLKNNHVGFIGVTSYICGKSNFPSLNYIERLSKSIDVFSIEVQIWKKLEVVEILNALRCQHQMEHELSIAKKKKEKNLKEKAIKEKIAYLKESYEREMQEAEKLEELYQNLLDKLEEEDKVLFKSKHPELTDETDFLDAFYAWQSELPDEHFDIDVPCVDMNQIKKEYISKLNNLQEELYALEEDEEDEEPYEEFSIFDFSFLEGMVKIKAILIMAECTPITLPKTLKEIKDSIMRIDIKQAVRILLSNADIQAKLEVSEIDYLKTL